MSKGIQSQPATEIAVHLAVLKMEVDYLSKRLLLNDTGHISTAIGVLEERIKEMQKGSISLVSPADKK
jgi:hypothetical protein